MNSALPATRGSVLDDPCIGALERGRETAVRRRRGELLAFAALLLVFNAPLLAGSRWLSMIFLPDAVMSGQWWRLFTHAFVHVSWYHLLLDGSAFLLLYHGLLEAKLRRRLAYVIGGGAGSLLLAWATVPWLTSSGLCGLSGIAHGLMAVSAVEMIAGQPRNSPQWRIGLITFLLVAGKAAIEAWSGRMFFTWLHFVLMGDPVAVSHAGGVIGALLAMLLTRLQSRSGVTSTGEPSLRRPSTSGGIS